MNSLGRARCFSHIRLIISYNLQNLKTEKQIFAIIIGINTTETRFFQETGFLNSLLDKTSLFPAYYN
ncbi:hypothetical protein WA1_42915 [Scytonema hofmannii PCC 7110]|uniref:Uncharacterized protein n=1 Tax=Scytonema hofmannii PCC 7110 TaxID=128403 RepID=A0A139WVL0_9CYAN|nr:hypothetical protein WA1_42915 [Scytonema hofmannii PCC 7110]